MAPYYMMMRLPGETHAEFFLMLPMAPSQRENMIAWLAARCDLPDYGKLIVYEFPKEKLVYGPFQIEARINQNTEISQQISLWNQMGSRVIRGQSSGGADRELDPVRVAAVSARGVGAVAGTQAGDRGVRRPRGDGGHAARGAGGAVQGIRPGWSVLTMQPVLRRPAPRTRGRARRSRIMIGRSST